MRRLKGREVRALRFIEQVGIVEMGKRIGYSISHISQVENGERAVTERFDNEVKKAFAIDTQKLEELASVAELMR